MSRSEFFSQAAARYLDELDATAMTEQINQVVDGQGQVDVSASMAVSQGRRVLVDCSDDW